MAGEEAGVEKAAGAVMEEEVAEAAGVEKAEVVAVGGGGRHGVDAAATKPKTKAPCSKAKAARGLLWWTTTP